MSIPEPSKKINIPVFVAIVVVLGFMLAFGGLKLQGFFSQKTPLRVDASQVVEASLVEAPEAVDSRVVGSKTGRTYHLLDCPGAKQIAEKNKIYFRTRTEAERAGYTPAKNCKGLQNIKIE